MRIHDSEMESRYSIVNPDSSKTFTKLLNWILHSEFLQCISVVNQTSVPNATLLYLSKSLPVSVKELYATHTLFSSICICIVIFILVDYREWRRRRCTKENYILNHFPSYWWGVDMIFVLFFSSASRYTAEISDTHFKLLFD